MHKGVFGQIALEYRRPVLAQLLEHVSLSIHDSFLSLSQIVWATRVRETQSLKFETALEWGPECSPPSGGPPHGDDVLERCA
eukprot:9472347-Pyramimonas_sp.AAC.1